MSQTETKRTPGPCELGHVATFDLKSDAEIESDNSAIIFIGGDGADCECEVRVEGNNARANAAFIVRAWNAHDDLTDLLRDVGWVIEFARQSVVEGSSSRQRIEELQRRIAKALAKSGAT